jgi:hypothetical protein
MSWLARLKNSALPTDVDPAKPTKPAIAGFAGAPAALTPFFGGGDAHAVIAQVNTADRDESHDPDRWCWPNGLAMSEAEIQLHMRRQARFERLGLNHCEAEAMADGLMRRDRDALQEMVLCLECAHLRRAGAWACVNWRQAGWAASVMPCDLVRQLQRCPGFKEAS